MSNRIILNSRSGCEHGVLANSIGPEHREFNLKYNNEDYICEYESEGCVDCDQAKYEEFLSKVVKDD